KTSMRASILKNRQALVKIAGGHHLVGTLRGERYHDTGKRIRTLLRVDCDFDVRFPRDDGSAVARHLEVEMAKVIAVDPAERHEGPPHSELAGLAKVLERPRGFGAPAAKKDLARAKSLLKQACINNNSNNNISPAIWLEWIQLGASALLLDQLAAGAVVVDPAGTSLLVEAARLERSSVAQALAGGAGGYVVDAQAASQALRFAVHADDPELVAAL